MKKLNVFFLALLLPVSLVTGQEGGREMSVEEAYLQEAVDLMVIQEASRGGRDQQMIALTYIGEAIDRGNRGEEICEALEYLAMEGVMSKARENGRLVNDFPDVRRQAARYLGELGSPEAKNTLIRLVSADREPMVLQEAVRSL
jgi:hypothetical protein